MPIIQVQLLKGHDKGAKTRLINGISDAYRMVIPSSHAAITVFLTEVDQGNFMRGGAMRRRVEALPEPTALLRAHVAAMRDGDFAKAATFLTEDCTFQMPGGKMLASPVEVMEWYVERTTTADFRVTQMDAMPSDRGPVVYMHGLVSGAQPDGSRYENKRWLGRFAYDRDKIYDVRIWDDAVQATRGEDDD